MARLEAHVAAGRKLLHTSRAMTQLDALQAIEECPGPRADYIRHTEADGEHEEAP